MSTFESEVCVITVALEAYLYQRKLSPPGNYALYSPLMVVCPKFALKNTPWEKILDLLPEDDWFVDGGQPCLLLGEAVMRPDGRYYPEERYDTLTAIEMTKLFRAPQKKSEQKERENAEKRKQRDHYLQLRADQQRLASENKRLEIEKAAMRKQFDPMEELRVMKERLDQLEAEKKEQERVET